MKVVHLQTTDLGGSYRAVLQIHQGLLMNGIDSVILLRTKQNPKHEGEEVINTPFKKFFSRTKNVINNLNSGDGVDTMLFGTDMTTNPHVREADVIIVHWINSFISDEGIERLTALNKPVIIVAHDMYFMTGGCHTDAYCGGYERGCTDCPMIGRAVTSPKVTDQITTDRKVACHRASRNFNRKKECYKNVSLFIGPSSWSESIASKSAIWDNHRIMHIHNPIDTKIFKPFEGDKDSLKSKFNVPKDKKVILYGMAAAFSDTNKAAGTLPEVLNGLDKEMYQLVVFGNKENDRLDGVELDTTYLGYVSGEEQLSLVYAMADVFLTTSGQESFGYTVAEALAVGIPVVAYRVGGIIDQVEHGVNGFLAEYGHPKELNEGIRYWETHTPHYIEPKNTVENIGAEYAGAIKSLL